MGYKKVLMGEKHPNIHVNEVICRTDTFLENNVIYKWWSCYLSWKFTCNGCLRTVLDQKLCHDTKIMQMAKYIKIIREWKMKSLCCTITKCDKQTPCLLGLGIICKWQNCKIIYENYANGKIWKHFSHKNRVKCNRIWKHFNPWK